MPVIRVWKVASPGHEAGETVGPRPPSRVEAPKAVPQSVNLNINTGGEAATVTVDETPDETTEKRTTTTHSEVRQSD